MIGVFHYKNKKQRPGVMSAVTWAGNDEGRALRRRGSLRCVDQRVGQGRVVWVEATRGLGDLESRGEQVIPRLTLHP